MGSQPTPYLGSKISLISKSEIRYEGILYTVDTKESTIALAKVQSFGTEDRPTERPVAPRDEVYEYIIFKASDIKDLMVCETPKPVPQLRPGLPYDPAIVSVSSTPGAHTVSTSMASGGGFGPASRQLGIPSGSTSPRSASPHQRRSVSPGDVIRGGGGELASRAPGAGRNFRGQPKNFSGNQFENRGGFGSVDVRRQPQRGGFQRDGGPPQSYRNAVTGGRGGGGGGGYSQPHRGGFGDRPRGGFGDRPRGWNQGPPRGGGGFHSEGPRRNADANRQPVKFEGDYDFEQANEQFKETLTKLKIDDDSKEKEEEKKEKDEDEEEEEEEEEGEHKEDGECYNKTKSFFDTISCEALERQEGKNTRPDWNKEREQNFETFGQSAVRNYQHRRGMRGFHRGGGFRGGNRGYGRGGGGGYSGRY